MTIRLARLVATAMIVAACSGSSRKPDPPPPTSTAARNIDPIDAALDAIDKKDLVADVAWLTGDDLAGRGSLSEHARAAADRLEKILRREGLEVTRQPIPSAPGQDNVVAILRGESPGALIVSAHYDHIGVIQGVVHPGADDNASGVAVGLSLVRAARAARAADPKTRRRTVVFFFSGAEEEGLLGAAAYVDAPIVPLEETRAVLNFDMVGRTLFELALGKDNAIAVVGLESDPELENAVVAAAEAEGVELVAVSSSMLSFFGFDARTDDHMFRRAGVPAAHFSTAIHRDYHRPTDTADKIKPVQMLRVARVAGRTLLALW